jgi:hypothetical protein
MDSFPDTQKGVRKRDDHERAACRVPLLLEHEADDVDASYLARYVSCNTFSTVTKSSGFTK